MSTDSNQQYPRQIKFIPIESLRPRRRNARTHSQRQVGQIANSISRFGWTAPVVVDESCIIIAGHGRFEAAKRLDLQQVPVLVVSGLSDAEKRALALADNKIATNAGWDRSLLAAELGELANLLPECGGLDIAITGFEAPEIDELMGDLVDSEQDSADAAPEIARRPACRKGELWQLDRHRVFCGDSRDPADVATLMGGERAAMAFTDPPYNLPISRIQGRGKIRHRDFVAACGEMSPEQYTQFLAACLSLAAKHSIDGAIHFVCIDWRHIGELLAAGREVYAEQKNLAMWAKTNVGYGAFYRSQHELVGVFLVGGAPHINNLERGRHGRNRSNLWTYPGVNTFRNGRLDDLSIHPTVKPVAMVADAMKDCSRRGDIILDPFLGSGTTILAAERVGRRGYGLELDPLYVDATIRRWQDFTHRDAILLDTAQTFDEVMAARTIGGVAP